MAVRIVASIIMLVNLWILAMPAQAASAVEIDQRVTSTLNFFTQSTYAGKKLIEQASGVLVFPQIYQAGVGVGGGYGEGALLEGKQTSGYYNIAFASIGFQLGAQVKSQIVLFMTPQVLAQFKASQGWEVGVDGSITLVTIGAAGSIDTSTIQDPILGFVFSNKGLMYNLSLEGSKITRIHR